jgi:hypothetical protein
MSETTIQRTGVLMVRDFLAGAMLEDARSNIMNFAEDEAKDELYRGIRDAIDDGRDYSVRVMPSARIEEAQEDEPLYGRGKTITLYAEVFLLDGSEAEPGELVDYGGLALFVPGAFVEYVRFGRKFRLRDERSEIDGGPLLFWECIAKY